MSDNHDWQTEQHLADKRAFEMMQPRPQHRAMPEETTDEYLTQIERENIAASDQ